MMLTVDYGQKQITFELVRKNVKHINVTVQPDQSIFVSANKNIDVKEIKSFVQSKGRWITSKMNYFERHMPYEKISREYVTGETFRYLSKQYRLRTIESAEQYVRFFRGTIEMYVKDLRDFRKKRAVAK